MQKLIRVTVIFLAVIFSFITCLIPCVEASFMGGFLISPGIEVIQTSEMLGNQGIGGTEPFPPSKIQIEDFINLAGDSSADESSIIDGLMNNGYVNPCYSDGTINPDYKDANGNILIIGDKWIKYDADNRPVKIITADGSVTEMVYDYEGHRVKKSVDGVETLYIGDLYEVTPTETIKHIHAGNQRIASIGSVTGTNYIHTDHLGSTSVLTDESGNVVQGTKYTPYGSVWETTANLTDHKYTGQKADDSTGLYYYGARYYDPAFGRFISGDPKILETDVDYLLEPKNLNPYVYVWNNPINAIDPTGKEVEFLIGGPYKGHRYGHTALRVFGKGYDFVYDYGRYGKTWGRFGSEGDGILRVWTNFDSYISGQNSLGRTTSGYLFKTTLEQDRAVISFFNAKVEGLEPKLATKDMQQFKIKDDYHALKLNCTSISEKGFKKAFPGFSFASDKFNQGLGLNFYERSTTSLFGWPNNIFMPADLNLYLNNLNSGPVIPYEDRIYKN